MPSLACLLLLCLTLCAYGESRCFTPREVRAMGVKPFDRGRDATTILEADSWRGHQLTTELTSIVLGELMGYPLKMMQYSGGAGVFERLANGSVDVNMEVWPLNARVSYKRYVTDKGIITDKGPLGVTGLSGWYVPASTVSAQGDATPIFWDFWRALKLPEAKARYPACGSTPANVQLSAPFIPPICSNNISSCFEFLAFVPEFGEGILQQQIRNLELPICLVYVSSPTLEAEVVRRVVNNQSILFYFWEPSAFISQGDYQRVELPAYSDSCFANNTGSHNGYGSVNCDFPPETLVKLMRSDLSNKIEFQDMVKAIAAVSFSTADQQYMLNLMSANASAAEAACQWLRRSDTKATWMKWIHNEGARRDTVTKGLEIAVIVLTVMCLVVMFVYLTLLVKYREHQVIKASSWMYMVLINIGGVGALVSIFFLINIRDADCRAFLFLLGCSVVLALSCLIAKSWRVNKLFKRAGQGQKLNFTPLTDIQLLRYVALALVVEILMDIIWVSTDPPMAVSEVRLSGQQRVVGRVCANGGPWLWLSVMYKAVVVLYGVFLAFESRDLPGGFSEAKTIGLSLYNMAICQVVAAVIIYAVDGEDVPFATKSFVIMWGAMFTSTVIFAPKLYYVFTEVPEDYFYIPKRIYSNRPSVNSIATIRAQDDTSAMLSLAKHNTSDYAVHTGQRTTKEAEKVRILNTTLRGMDLHKIPEYPKTVHGSLQTTDTMRARRTSDSDDDDDDDGGPRNLHALMADIEKHASETGEPSASATAGPPSAATPSAAPSAASSRFLTPPAPSPSVLPISPIASVTPSAVSIKTADKRGREELMLTPLMVEEIDETGQVTIKAGRHKRSSSASSDDISPVIVTTSSFRPRRDRSADDLRESASPAPPATTTLPPHTPPSDDPSNAPLTIVTHPSPQRKTGGPTSALRRARDDTNI